MILHGDCLEVLKTLPDESVDSLVTDPPAGISFMGKSWDCDKGGRKQWCAWMESVMAECLRVLKPGAHGLVWAIPRTSHWTAMALEDAGFEVRDVITHIFGSGFPKSMDISKAIDKAAGAEREVIGSAKSGSSSRAFQSEDKTTAGSYGITAPATDDAKKWQGFGTALKPAAEFWWLVRKPCSEKTVAANVLKHGTGALNIDASRIGTEQRINQPASSLGNSHTMDGGRANPDNAPTIAIGRFPANLVLSCTPYCTEEMHDIECAIQALDAQAGVCRSSGSASKTDRKWKKEDVSAIGFGQASTFYDDNGGPSRFFYCAKISSSERNAGLEHLEATEAPLGDDRPSGQSMSRLDGRPPRKAQNTHPTVKPKKLMAYLIKLITPPGGTVLDPFTGSGSTGVAAKEQGFDFIGIEKEDEYLAIAKARIEAARAPV